MTRGWDPDQTETVRVRTLTLLTIRNRKNSDAVSQRWSRGAAILDSELRVVKVSELKFQLQGEFLTT